MTPLFAGLTLELVPHCASVRPQDWTGDHGTRPLAEAGHRQAEALVGTMGRDIDAIYSSPALRCVQTVRPLSAAAGVPVVELVELLEAPRLVGPRQWTHGTLRPFAEALGGGWAAGHALRALATMARHHPRGRVVAASHGDIVHDFLAMLCAAYAAPLPTVPNRGGWYTIRFGTDSMAVTMNGVPAGS